jgi:TPR repeat protein
MARWRTSGENLFVVLLISAPLSQKLEPPANPARFSSGVSKDMDKALELYKRAASQGDSEAVVEVGRYYSKGPAKNVDLAITWLTSVETGEAFLALGDLYLSEVKNDAIALKWYRKAAELKMPQAYERLGSAYYDGRGVPQDDEEALMWHKLAWEELPRVTVLIASYYQRRNDTEQMLQWAERGAARGDARSADALARTYRFSSVIAKDLPKALSWYQRAYELGDDGALAEIGRMYQHGEGVQQDIPRAIEYYRKAIEKGRSVYWRVADAYENMSPRDDHSAFEWHKKGAEAGEALSMYYLAAQYRDGTGVKQNYKEALDWYKKAAGTGDRDAMNQVGRFYDFGWSVKRNYVEAGRWYEKAAANGQAWGNRNLASLFANGRGVNRDIRERNEEPTASVID